MTAPRLDLDTALRQLRAKGATDDELLHRDLPALRRRGATDAQLLALAAGLGEVPAAARLSGTVDRFEGGQGVVERPGRADTTVARRDLPPGAREGDVLADGRLDRAETERRRREGAARLARLRERR